LKLAGDRPFHDVRELSTHEVIENGVNVDFSLATGLSQSVSGKTPDDYEEN
jgi:hypothetical protein